VTRSRRTATRPTLPRIPTEPELSVVVPTRDRPAALSRCLRALERQTILDRLEIVVVDDGSDLRRTISEIAANTRQTRLRRTEGRGPAAARNSGVDVVRAPVVCFLDDDCEPDRQWAELLASSIERGADVAAGRTTNLRGDPLAGASQTIANFLAQPAAGNSHLLEFAPSCNLACRTEIVRSIKFDENYAYPGGEDRDWCARLLAAGFVIVREPRALVLHRQELSLPAFCRQQFRYGQGAFRFRRGHPELPRTDAGEYCALLHRGFGEGMMTGLCVCLAQVATAAGYAYAAVDRDRKRQ
jgi:glycosyltransferase involved in cell wall biosynthesis